MNESTLWAVYNQGLECAAQIAESKRPFYPKTKRGTDFYDLLTAIAAEIRAAKTLAKGERVAWNMDTGKETIEPSDSV